MGRGHINLGPSTSGPEETGPSSAVTGLGCRSTNEDRLSFSESEEGEEDLDSHRRREIGKDGMLSPLWRVKSTWEKGEPSSSSLVDETGVLRKSGAVQLRPGATVTTTRTDENQVEREKEINTIRLMNPSNLKPTGLFPVQIPLYKIGTLYVIGRGKPIRSKFWLWSRCRGREPAQVARI